MTAVFPLCGAPNGKESSRDMGMVAHNPDGAAGRSRRINLPGGTESAVIDLASGSHDHGCIVAMHVTPGFRPGQPYHSEKLRIPPPGVHYDLRCEDCPSTVTQVANPPPCVQAAYIVTHSATCPWLAGALAGAA